MYDGLPDVLNITTSDGPDSIFPLGPTLCGAMYESKQSGCVYRVMSMAETPISVIHAARKWFEAPAKTGLAPIVEVSHSLDYEPGAYFIRYRVGERQSLYRLLQSANVGERFQALSMAFQALPDWWKSLCGSEPVLPMPADIVVAPNSQALLLSAPFRPTLSEADVFRTPARAKYLSPQRLRGTTHLLPDAEDLYAMAVMLLEALYVFHDFPIEELLLRIATRSYFLTELLQTAVPPWMDGFDCIQEARNAGLNIVQMPESERMGIRPLDLASRLKTWARLQDPRSASELLRNNGKSAAALKQLQGVLRYQESYELLLLAASIAANDLNQPLEAMEFMERAIAVKTGQPEAYTAQLDLLPRLMRKEAEEQALPPSLAARLESILWRDFSAIPASLQTKHAETVSGFLLSQKKYDQAADFIYPRLFDEDRKHLWWKFDLNLDYIEALIALQAKSDASMMLNLEKTGLKKVMVNRTLGADEIHRVGKRLAELERYLLAGTQQAAGGSQP